MNTLRNFAKSVFDHISAKFEYFAKHINGISIIYSYFSLKFEIFSGAIVESFRENCSKRLEIKIFCRFLK